MSLCACGCGQTTPVFRVTDRARGRIKGEHARYIRGHNSRGETNPNWNNGQAKNAAGYVLRRVAPGYYEYEHRFVMAAYLGRALSSEEVVHHIDGNRQNNALSNLMVLSQGEHARLERRLKPYSEAALAAMRRASQRRRQLNRARFFGERRRMACGSCERWRMIVGWRRVSGLAVPYCSDCVSRAEGMQTPRDWDDLGAL